MLAYHGEPDRAFERLGKAISYQDRGLSSAATEPLLKNPRSDPRRLPFLREIRRALDQLTPIKFDVRVPRT